MRAGIGFLREDMEKILRKVLSGIKENPRRSGNYEIFGQGLNINEPDRDIERAVSKIKIPEYSGDIDRDMQAQLKKIVGSFSGFANGADMAFILTDWKYKALKMYSSQKNAAQNIQTSVERRTEWLKCSLKEIICRLSNTISKEKLHGEKAEANNSEQLIDAIYRSAELRGMRHLHMSQIEADEFFLKELYHAVPLPKLPELDTVHISEKRTSEAAKSGKAGDFFADGGSNLMRNCAQTSGKIKKPETENYRKILITEDEMPEIKREKTMEQKMRRMYTDGISKRNMTGSIDGKAAATKAEFLPELSLRRYKERNCGISEKSKKQAGRGKI